MGETSPAPASASAAASLGAPLSSGPVSPLGPPRVHRAIVERLRARLALCRQHHLSCEGRYARGRAESAGRERESTLQLLRLVQHGGGPPGRKAGPRQQGPKAPPAPAPAADYYPPPLGSTAPGTSSSTGSTGTSSSPGEQRHSALIALQGSLKRKLVVNLSPANNKRSNGIADHTFIDIKRVRVGDNNFSTGHGHCPNPSVLGSLTAGQGSQGRVSSPTNNTHSNPNGMFNMTLKEVKKEPGETHSCSKHSDNQASQSNPFPNRYGEDMGDQLMDPELQELFNELTNISVPPMSDLELENMINATIKQDEPFNIDLGQQIPRTPPARSSSVQMDKVVIKQEYSPALNQASTGSPQMRPSSTGPAFTMSTAAMSTSSPIPSVPQTHTPPSQVTSVPSRPLASWQEVSHAQQLKQIAANRQQHAMIQQCQQGQPTSSWPTLSSTEPPPGSFVQEKIASPPFHQQQFSPQNSGVPVNGSLSKGMNAYIYRSNALSQGSSVNPMMQRKTQDLSRGYIGNSQLPLEEPQNNIKPLFHFNSEQPSQQMPSALSSQNKPSIQHYAQQQQQQQPNSVAVQPQTQQQQPTQQQQQQQSTQSLPRLPNVSLALQQKIMLQKMLQNQPLSRLQYPVPAQHQLDQHSVIGQSAGPSPASGTCTNPNAGSSYMNSPQQALLNQQLKQQLLLQQQQQQQQQQQILTEAEKITPQDQLNRHLTRPLPEYKDQRRNQVNVQQNHQYSSGSSSVSISSSLCFSNPISTLTQTSNLLSTAHGTRMPSLATSHHMGCYGNVPRSQPSAYNMTSSGASLVSQHRNANQIVSGQNSPAASRQLPSGQGNNLSAFDNGSGINSQQGKLSLNQGPSTQRPANVMVSSNSTSQNWVSPETGAKQPETRKPIGSPFSTGSSYTSQPLQRTAAHQQFPQRTMVPTSQLATVQMRTPMSQMNQTLNGQVAASPKSQNARPNQVRAQAMPNLNPAGVGMSSPPHSLSSNHFSSTASQTSARAYQGTDHASELAFDFLNQQGDNIGPALNSDPDFIDSLLKTEPGNDDWMKDINLDEILGGHS